MGGLITTCYLSSLKFFSKSLPIYEELIGEYPEYPMVLYRYGQALEKLGESVLGFSHIQDAYEKSNLIYETKNQYDNDVLPIKDYIHIISGAPLKLGYHIWKLADKSYYDGDISDEEFVAKLEEAYFVTEKVIKQDIKGVEEKDLRSRPLTSIRNNLLYYCCEIISTLNMSGKATLKWEAKLREHLDYLLTVAKIKDNDIRRFDTLSRAFFLLKDYMKAKEYTSKVLEFAYSDQKTDLSTIELHNLAKEAYSLQKRMDEI